MLQYITMGIMMTYNKCEQILIVRIMKLYCITCENYVIHYEIYQG